MSAPRRSGRSRWADRGWGNGRFLEFQRLLQSNPTGGSGSSWDLRDLREGPTTAAIAELDQQTLCLALHAVPRVGAPLTGGHPTSRVALSRRTPYSAEGRVTSRLRQYLGSALAAEP